MPDAYSVILTTVGTREEADRLAELLVTRQLAACVQITPVSSVYVWNGALQTDSEQLLFIKTAARRYAEVESAIRENHSYEVPEVLHLPIERGLPAYLAWISEHTAQG